MNKIFVDGGIYKLNKLDDIFLCQGLANNKMAKLIRYRKIKSCLYEKTNLQYFLNSYQENDIKSLFLNRSNYDMLGRLNSNYLLSSDNKFIIGNE